MGLVIFVGAVMMVTKMVAVTQTVVVTMAVTLVALGVIHVICSSLNHPTSFGTASG